MIMFLSLTFSIMFILLKHPLSMGITLLMKTIIITLTMGFFNMNYWYSYILFLIMIGGMLVLFIYMTSIASNEMFFPSIKILCFIIFMMMIMLILYFSLDHFYILLNNMIENMNNKNNFMYSLNKYLNYPNNLISYMLIIYLLITLFAIVKITNLKKGALRQLK
uniref:NADH-ubiquinone oxidoreductase chain 6 n=1 Tax=Coleoptera sp. 7 KM-2017 TaxID=2219341 RepID=A0A346RGB3_9COLE|nr:NADH dehydrogenase subunit 6 [Coleoptera sp. 7 KM-2017]